MLGKHRLRVDSIQTRKLSMIFGILACICTLLCFAYILTPVRERIRTAITTAEARISRPATTPFPAISSVGLSAKQIQIINVARQQYAKHPISYDQTVLTYSQGNKQAWCADFVSWIMLNVGNPYHNPNSGSWRIPGVYTLQQYYESKGGYANAGSYKPKPGDVAFYVGRRYFGLADSSHVALVVKVVGDSMTTVGGNESGRMRIDTQPIKVGVNRLVGFGRLASM